LNTEPIFVAGYKFPWPVWRLPQYKDTVARPARVLVAGIQDHVTHRGDRRQDILFPPAAIRKQDVKIRSKVKNNYRTATSLSGKGVRPPE